MTRIVLSGPESSGKSTLATALAERFQLPMAPEYARHFLQNGNPYPQSPEDLTELARQHLAWQRQHVPEDSPCGIYDTDMLNYFLWADVGFGRVPDEIEHWLAAETNHFHLVCEPDLPWQPDPLREFPEFDKRRALFDRHIEELEKRGVPHAIIHGEGEARITLAGTVVPNGLRMGRE